MKALEIKHLHKTYSNKQVALHDVNLEVMEGDFFALLGPNAAGKSTIMGIISSLVRKSAGEVVIFGHNLDENPQAAKECIGLVPQEFNFNKTQKVSTILETQAGFYGIPHPIAVERSEFYLHELGLWDKRHEEARYLSGGQKRKLMLGRALIHAPKLLILDEPTSGVDLATRRSIWRFLQELNEHGTTIILTTHYLEEAESLCKNIAIIDKGRVIAHSATSSLLQQLEVETLVLYLDSPMDFPPMLKKFFSKLLDQSTLEVSLEKEQSITELFTELSQHSLNVLSMRNKTNRLEELFLNLTSRTTKDSNYEH